MATSPLATRAEKYVYEFDAFRVDPIRRRLLRGGEQVPLTPKAFSILLVLLESRGKVVEKEALIQRVWPDTHVTEANLTQNVSSLRKALGERANDHRYVVTVPGRGYSFVSEVLEIPREGTGEIQLLEAFSSTLETGPVPVPPDPLDSTLVQSPPPPRGRRRFLAAGLVLGFVTALAAVGIVLFYKDSLRRSLGQGGGGSAPATATLRPTVAVMGFRNLSGNRNEAWLSTALSEMLITELSAGSRLRMVSGEEVARLKQTVVVPYTEGLSGETLQQIHERLGADLVVVGSYLSLGESGNGDLRIDLRVVNASSGDTVAFLAEVGKEEGLFDLVSRIGGRLRRTLGWSQPSPAEARAAQALLPTSPEAARLYAEGLIRLRAFDPRGARNLLQLASSVDPGSAVIHSSLSLSWMGLGDDAKAREEAEKAVRLAASLPKGDRLAIEARSHEARKDWAQASEIYRSLWTFYPDNLEYGLRLAGALSAAGRGPEALATVAEMRKLPPPAGVDPRVDLAEAEIAKRLSNFPVQMQAARRAEEKGRRAGETQVLAQALMLQGDSLLLVGRCREAIPLFEQARDLFDKAGNQSSVALALTHLGVALHEQGRLIDAEKMYQTSFATLQRIGSTQGLAIQKGNLGILERDIGDLPRAQPLLEEALATFTADGDRLLAAQATDAIGAILLARGDLAGARQRFETVLATSRQTGNRIDEGQSLSFQGQVLALQGSLKEALRLQEQAAEILRQVGDTVRGSTMQAASADAVMRLGDLPEAQRRFAQSLATKRKGEDRIGAAEVIGQLAQVQERLGNLAEAKRLGGEQMALARDIGSRRLAAAALHGQARWSLDEGDLANAHRRLEEALRARVQDGEDLAAAEVRLDLSTLDRLQGNPQEAARLATEAADWYGKREMAGYRARALARLSQALLAEGRLAPAKSAADQALGVAEAGEDLELRIAVATAVAPVRAAAGDAAAALDLLRWAIRESDRTGAVLSGLEARLALGLLQAQTGDPAGASSTLQEVRRNAEVRGFRGLAQRAQTGLRDPRP
ncbi:MAG TPA: tetratricopeptide repeat protein [Thermoanaerobaculia bacterium]|jgi:DNA-binding winged helix-turn-helix (wHTH) protein/tetratricopeptide (TPR) repeat protein/TolB-like protein